MAYKDVILADLPVGYWRLNDVGTSAVDSSGAGNTGSISGSGILVNQLGALAFDSDSSILFDGAAGYISVPDSTSLNINGTGIPMTVEAWVNMVTIPGNATAFHWIVGKTAVANNYFGGYILGIENATNLGKPFFTAGTDASQLYAAGSTGLSTGTWYHLVGVADGTHMTLYVNGLQAAQVNQSEALLSTSGQPLGIGGNSGSVRDVNAYIDEVAVYNYALSTTQISNHYLAGTAPVQPMLPQFAGGENGYGWKGNTVPAAAVGGAIVDGFTVTGGPGRIAYQLPAGTAVSDVQFGFDPASQSYPTIVRSDRPVAYWRLGDSGASAFDAVGGRNGALSGTGIQKNVPGPNAVDQNTGMLFDGASGVITIPFASALNPAIVSIEAWVKVLSYPPTATTGFYDSGDRATAGFALLLSTTGFPQFCIASGGTQNFLTGSSALVPGTWHHLVGTYDGTQGRIFVDGVLSGGPTTVSYTVNPSVGSVIGKNLGQSNFVHAEIAEVALYNTALSALQVAAHYAAATPPTSWFQGMVSTENGLPTVSCILDKQPSYASVILADQPVAYWRLGDSGTSAADSSGNGYSATAFVQPISENVLGALPSDIDLAMQGSGGSVATTAFVAALNPSPLSAEAWFFTSGLKSGNAQENFLTNRPGNQGFTFLLDGSGHLFWRVGDGTTVHDIATTASFFDGKWHHVVGTADGVTSQLYIDGVLFNSIPAGYQAATSGVTAIMQGTTASWNGGLDEAAIYDHILSPAQVLAHYKAARRGSAFAPQPGSVWWPWINIGGVGLVQAGKLLVAPK